MTEFSPRHLVLIRHGESEGDVRRNAIAAGLEHPLLKHPRDEAQTDVGHKQSKLAGTWVVNNIIKQYEIGDFDHYLVSPLKRTIHSAYSTGLSDSWQHEENLAERNRGIIQGLTKEQHKTMFPNSFDEMTNYPFHWAPPKGESILRVAHRVGALIKSLNPLQNYVFMTHRDVIWASQQTLDHKSLVELEATDTRPIVNGIIVHYTNINPTSGLADSQQLIWKRTVNPTSPTTLSAWQKVTSP